MYPPPQYLQPRLIPPPPQYLQPRLIPHPHNTFNPASYPHPFNTYNPASHPTPAQIPYYLDENNKWGLNKECLEKSLAASTGCLPRAVVVINPGNPTG